MEQRPRWVLVARGQTTTLHCILRNSQYPWLSWYQQDLQGQLQVLATLRSPGDEEVVSRPGADYRVRRVDSTELRLHVTNVTQGRTLYCTCSTDTVREPPWTSEYKPSRVASHRPSLLLLHPTPLRFPTSSLVASPLQADSSLCSACPAQRRLIHRFNP